MGGNFKLEGREAGSWWGNERLVPGGRRSLRPGRIEAGVGTVGRLSVEEAVRIASRSSSYGRHCRGCGGRWVLGGPKPGNLRKIDGALFGQQVRKDERTETKRNRVSWNGVGGRGKLRRALSTVVAT